jgi:hypothetical protein
MVNPDDDLLREVISRIQTRVRKADDAQRLSQELKESVSVNYSRIFRNSIERQKGSAVDIFSTQDTVRFGGSRGLAPSLLAIANMDGSQIFSTLAALKFADSVSAGPCTVYITPKVGPFRSYGEKIPDFFRKIEGFLDETKVDLAIIIRDGHLFFDGFYISLLDEMQHDLAKRVVDKVRDLGHQTGKYSLRDDDPTYEVVHSDDELFKLFVKSNVPALGFTVTEDFQACSDALGFVLSDLAGTFD